MITFITFLESFSALEKWEDLLHHIAEEELVACKVFSITMKSSKRGISTIKFVADCNDDPRNKGLQKDLSQKLTTRLAKHDMKGLGKIKAQVFHSDIDPR